MSQLEQSQNEYIWPDTVKGTAMKAVRFVVEKNGTTPSTTLTAVSVKFAKDGAVTISPTVTINDAATWDFTVNTVAASSMGIAEGIHVGDIKTTDSAGDVEKYVRAQITILPSPQ